MEFDLGPLIDNLTNPALLFFFLGILAVQVKSDLCIPENSSRFISLYLLFAIGFKGGNELSHSALSPDILWGLGTGLILATVVPIYVFFLLRKRYRIPNAAAIAASFGSVSAVTFVTAISYLEMNGMGFGGHMVAVMALMEAPAIIVGVFLLNLYRSDGRSEGVKSSDNSIGKVLKHALTNGSVFLILGSLVIGYLASDQQAEGIRPFTTDIFKGFLAVFLLDMGITSGRELGAFVKKGWFGLAISIGIPLVNGILVAILSGLYTDVVGDRFLIAILAASASYIAVPAAMKNAAPEANPSIYLPMALGVAFPFNITFGMPLYLYITQMT